jgi:hypothetical protein
MARDRVVTPQVECEQGFALAMLPRPSKVCAPPRASSRFACAGCWSVSLNASFSPWIKLVVLSL